MRKILQFILKILAKQVINRYKPTVIGITGSVGKTFAKEAISHVLNRKFWVWKNEENFNNEIGVPMAVLGIDTKRFQVSGSRFQSISHKLKAISSSLWLAYGWPKQKYPEILVLELAADRPGDIQYLVDIVKPKIGVITAVGEIPVHVEFYASPQAVAREKSKLIENLPTDGLAVLNYDDQTVIDMKEKTGAKALTFGFSNRADIWISDISYFAADDGKDVGGLSFKINNGDIFVPARINNLIGAHQLCSAMAAAAVGLRLGMNLVDISGALENVEPPERRMKLLRGIKNSAIIDDSYNASPLSVRAALDALRDFAKARSSFSGIRGRKIAVLGDMRELGKYEIEAHRAIGNLVGERANTLITVGAAAKFIADSAANQTKQGSIFSFNTADEAKTKVQEIIREGDVVLIKGSRAMQMEKIVEEIKEVL
jgi:UDP-N-acetylmuramoyl-tripeptide--D-alanyl-D-alanine ligase